MKKKKKELAVNPHLHNLKVFLTRTVLGFVLQGLQIGTCTNRFAYVDLKLWIFLRYAVTCMT